MFPSLDTVSEKGVTMQPEKIEAVQKWPSCRNLTELRVFLGTCGYYRRFIKGLYDIAALLNRLLRKDTPFRWDEACQHAFETLKAKLLEEPVLPNDEDQYILDTDASDFGLGAVLSQIQQGEEKVIAYASCSLATAERHYETTRKELLAIVYGLKQFRQYLTGRYFVIRTDHAALSWLRRTPSSMPQLARWLTFIEEFDYEVVHRKGKKYSNADGLSCMALAPIEIQSSTQEDTLDTEEEADEEVYVRAIGTETKVKRLTSVQKQFAEVQQRDPEFGELVRLRLESAIQPELKKLLTASSEAKQLWGKWSRLEVKEGIVHIRPKDAKPRSNTLLQLVPRAEVKEVIQQCHGGVMGGHFGVRKTQDLVQRRFYWIGWKKDVEQFCKTCDVCCRYHGGQLRKQGPLQTVVAGSLYEQWYIDLTGSHPRSERGNVYILTCIDSFTKWAEAFPIRNKEAETVAKVLVEQLFCRFGAPISLFLDQGTEVDCSIMQNVCKLLKIDKLRTTAYKPSTNQVERLHRTLNSILAKTVDRNHRDWDSKLSYAMAANRASRHDSTGYTPNYLVLGREARMPVDLIYGTSQEEEEVTYDGYAGKIRERLLDAYAETRVSLKRAVQTQKKYYDLKVKPTVFEKGSWVYYFHPQYHQGKQDKWIRKYLGPYLVVDTPSSVNVITSQTKGEEIYCPHR